MITPFRRRAGIKSIYDIKVSFEFYLWPEVLSDLTVRSALTGAEFLNNKLDSYSSYRAERGRARGGQERGKQNRKSGGGRKKG